ncbi:peptidoglycan DD-metalloendopeptidase family protein [Ferviditalea candida]|uniref:M23 family metallopeptidase n=1 Tax=Ferviditalea candida TaxID=3108399 RepID=A0ABU5ZJY3_9BACL|nr:M23 family metallopeptidase [Paenibacillaceae bacterium T2]
MKDINENQLREEASKSKKEAVQVHSPAWKRLLGRKWVFPAIYVAAAAIILTLMWAYQDSGKTMLSGGKNIGKQNEAATSAATDKAGTTSDALAVNANAEKLQWPVQDSSQVKVSMPFYDSEASSEQRQAAMLEYNDSFMPSTGISLSRQDNQSFDVLAAMSGKVTRVANLPLIGYEVEITHDNGLKTVYESLTDISVTEGASVKQGDVIAKAGRNELEKSLGIHLHFEVLQNGTPVNPEKMLSAKG